MHMLLKEHAGPVFALKWSKSGEFLLSGSFDRRAIVWSTQTGTVFKSFLLHTGAVMDVDWRDADYFASCSSDRLIVRFGNEWEETIFDSVLIQTI